VKETAVLAQLEVSRPLPLFTVLEAGIWRCTLYVTGGLLPFMQDTYNRERITVNSVIIDHVEYHRYETLDELRGLPYRRYGWVNAEHVIYIRFPDWNPPILFHSLQHGILHAFTNGSPIRIENMTYIPGLLTSPEVEQSADAFTYDRMRFNNANIEINNDNGQFDNVSDYFGNEFNLMLVEMDKSKRQDKKIVKMIDNKEIISIGDTDRLVSLIQREETEPKLKKLAQYYIANIMVTLDKATFVLKDKRERLSARIPNRQFTKKEYPDEFEFFEDNIIDRDMQEAYGHCFGVAGTCLNGKQVFQSGSSVGRFRFRFSSRITRIDRIHVKMTAGRITIGNNSREVNGWTVVYDRERTENDGWLAGITPCTNDIETGLDKGEIVLSASVAKQGGEITNRMNEVRMDGVFNVIEGERITPLEIITDILSKYSGLPFTDRHYNKKEITEELSFLDHEIGILFGNPVSVYEAIEQLQGGCVKGFKFHVHENLYTARLDNPDRKASAEVKHLDILNLHEVEIDWNAELYGTYTDIEYRFDYSEGEGRRFIDKTRRSEILELHRTDKVWEVKTLLVNESDAKERSNTILNDFTARRQLIKNIQLRMSKWLGLRVYDIVTIDFEIPSCPRHVKKIFEGREFAGRVKCQILRVLHNTENGIVTIDVRVMEAS